jgi:dTDP-4-dehydrorhamnose reductase
MVGKIKKILITGSKGMLGSSLCKALEEEFEVIGIDKEDCDITQKDKIVELVKNINADVVIHCAAYTDVDGAEDNFDQASSINVDGTKNVLDGLAKSGSLVIYISTDYVFDGQKLDSYTEEDNPNPLGRYGFSKLEAENLVKSFKKHCIVRTSWLFGPGGKNFVGTIINLAKDKKVLQVVNDQVGAPTYTLDLSKAIKDIIIFYFNGKLGFGIYNITNSGRCSWYEFANYIAELKNLDITVEPISSQKLERKAQRPINSLLSNQKFYNLTGYNLRSWQEAAKDYLEINYS